MSRMTRAVSVSPTTPSLVTPHHTRPTPGLLPSWAPLPAPLSRSGCQATKDLQDPSSWVAPPLCTLKRLHGDLLQQYDCTEQAAPPPPPPSAGGGAAANAGAHPQPPAGSQDTINGKLLLPQLDRLHLAFKRSQVSSSASSSSQDQQSQHFPKSVIPTQRRVTRNSSPRIGRPSRSCVSATARASRNNTSFTSLRSTRPQSRTPPCAWR